MLKSVSREYEPSSKSLHISAIPPSNHLVHPLEFLFALLAEWVRVSARRSIPPREPLPLRPGQPSRARTGFARARLGMRLEPLLIGIHHVPRKENEIDTPPRYERSATAECGLRGGRVEGLGLGFAL